MININPKFKLKEPTSDTPSLIILIVYYLGKRLVYSTGLHIHPEYWNKKSEQVILVKGDKVKSQKHKDYNFQLNKYKNKIEKIFSYCNYNDIIPSNSYLKKEMDKEFMLISNKPISFLEFIEVIINESEKGIRLTPKGTKYKQGSTKNYKVTLKHLKEYQKYKNKKIDFDSITIKFYQDYIKYFNETYYNNDNETQKNYTLNTIGKNIKDIKVFMEEATKRGLNINLDYRKREFRTIKESTDQIYLNEEEIKKIYDLDLSNNEKLDRVRDVFIIGCYTGLRFSDLSQLKQTNIKKDRAQIKITTQKTDEIVVIPLHWMVKQILNKYDGNIPRVISNQKMNEYLKEIGEMAQINEKVSISKTRGGARVDDEYNKFNLITVHTARRSFATNMFINDIPSISIMKITGHKTEKAFLTYIKISQEENADKLLKHPFFNK